MLSIVTLIGRPNVGKSTIFNLLTNTKDQVVADYPGLTRDRKYGKLSNSSITLVDTGGIGTGGNLSKEVLAQTELAIDEADGFLLILDAKEGMLPLDQEIATKLRKTNKKLIPIINKIDVLSGALNSSDFTKLGFEDLFHISAAHNRGIRDLHELLIGSFPEDQQIDLSNEMSIAIVGRPNVGKSTLLNKLLGKERALVSSEAGTTRDSVEGSFVYRGKRINLIDTAGMRRKRSIQEATEKSFVGKSVAAIRKSQVVIVMIDGTEALVDQDLHLISLAAALGKAIVVAVNKVDVLDAEAQRLIINQIERKLRFASYIDFTFVSSKEGRHIGKLLNIANRAYISATQDLDTSNLNDILNKAVDRQTPAMKGRFRPKLKYAHPGGKNPPSIVIHGNNISDLQPSYIRYLENFFRSHLELSGSPLFIKLRETENPFKDKKNILTDRQKKKRKRVIKKRSK